MDYQALLSNSATQAPSEFDVSWRSSVGSILILFILFVAGFALAAVFQAGVKAFVWGIAAAFCALMLYLLGRSFWGSGSYLEFGCTGIDGKAVKGKPISWGDVAKLSLQSVQGHAQLQIDLVPLPGNPVKRNFFTGYSSVKRIIPLGPIKKTEHAHVLEAAQQAFLRYAPMTAAKAIELAAEERRVAETFEARLRDLTPKVWAMPAVMTACVLVWIANIASGMSFIQPRADELYRWGASSASAVQTGDWWRLVTAMFLHGGIVHLALNMYALWEAGFILSRLFGNRGFLLVYFGSGIVGSALSLHFSGQTAVSVGASGAVFGVVGALLAAVVQHRGTYPVERSQQLITSLSIFILYSLMYGFSGQGIDNAAHVGGLIAGFAAGWLLIEKIDNKATKQERLHHFLAGGVLCLIGALVLTMTTPPAKRDMGQYFSDLKVWKEVQPEFQRALKSFQQEAEAAKAGKLSEEELVRNMRASVVPKLRQIEARLAALHLPAEDGIGRYVSVQKRLVAAMAGVVEAQGEYVVAPSPQKEAEVKRWSDEVKAATQALGQLNQEMSKKHSKR